MKTFNQALRDYEALSLRDLINELIYGKPMKGAIEPTIFKKLDELDRSQEFVEIASSVDKLEKTKELHELGKMLTATTIDDTDRLKALAGRLNEIIHPFVSELKEQGVYFAR